MRSRKQGLDNVHKQRVAEVLNDPEHMEKGRSRESLDVVKYESGPDGGEEVSMSVEWNGVSTVPSDARPAPLLCHLSVRLSVLAVWGLPTFSSASLRLNGGLFLVIC